MSIITNVEQLTGLTSAHQIKVAVTILILISLSLVRTLTMRAVLRRTSDVRSIYTWRKAVTNTTVLLAVLAIARVWFVGLADLTTYFGLLSAGLAIALRDLFVNLAGWLFITWRKPFIVGDRIQIGNHAGDVIDIRIFQFTLMEIGNWVGSDQPTGRLLHIPNGKVFIEPQANYTKAFRFIWNEIPVLVTFESDWKKAKGLLEEIAKEHTAQFSSLAQVSFVRLQIFWDRF